MKIFSNKFLFIFALSSIIAFGSCSMVETVPPIEKTVKKANANLNNGNNGIVVKPVIIDAAAYQGISAPFTITGLTIEDEIIMFSVTYNGGCGSVDFSLVSDGSVSNINGKPLINLKLMLDDRDGCKKSIDSMAKFDLTPIHQPYYSNMIINIVGFGSVTYSY